MKTDIMERRGKIADLDRTFDLQFWQAQSSQSRFDAAWDMIMYAWRMKGNDVRQLRLQRSIETFQRQEC